MTLAKSSTYLCQSIRCTSSLLGRLRRTLKAPVAIVNGKTYMNVKKYSWFPVREL